MTSASFLIVDDELSMREFLTILFERDGYTVYSANGGEEALEIIEKHKIDLIISDLNMPNMSGIELLKQVKQKNLDISFIVVTAFGSTESAIEALKLGASNYVLKPFNNDELRLVVKRALGVKALEVENKRLKVDQQKLHFGCLVGSSPSMLEVYELIRRVKDSRINCMIVGESGTGKELVARAIHKSGNRQEHPFVAINCGAIPENLMESELFGHRKGSFTGAIRDKIGLLRAAHKGTLFLDEVDSLPLSAQVKLLRAIQEKAFTPVGDIREVNVDTRIVTATNSDLENAVNIGTFREDLFYRLNVVQISIPPLRDRGDDLEELVRFFVNKSANDYGKSIIGIVPDVFKTLRRWHFKGNVRELQNLVERAVVLCPGNVIQLADLPTALQNEWELDSSDVPTEFPENGINLDAILENIEKKWLMAAMQKAKGRKGHAAKLLQMTFRSFRYRLSKYGME